MLPLRERLIVIYRSFGTRQLAALGAALVVVLAVVLIAVLAGGSSHDAQPSTAVAVSPIGAAAPSAPPRVQRHHSRHDHASRARTRRATGRRQVRRSPAAKSSVAPRATSTSKPRAAGGAAPASGGRHRRKPVSAPTSTRASSITFAIKGGGDASVNACGATRHYRTYAAGALVRFAGTVNPIPSGRWKVKLKIKVCAGGTFAPFAKLDAVRDKHRGTFAGTFAAPPAGRYSVRAVLYINGSLARESVKHHLQTH